MRLNFTDEHQPSCGNFNNEPYLRLTLKVTVTSALTCDSPKMINYDNHLMVPIGAPVMITPEYISTATINATTLC